MPETHAGVRVLLRRHDFRFFFTGQTVSLLGNAMSPVALAFAVLSASHDNAGDLGVVLTAHMIPLLAFLLSAARPRTASPAAPSWSGRTWARA